MRSAYITDSGITPTLPQIRQHFEAGHDPARSYRRPQLPAAYDRYWPGA